MAKVKSSGGKVESSNGAAVKAIAKPAVVETADETEVTFDSFDVTISRLPGGKWRLAIEGGAEHPTLSGEVLTVQTMKSLDGIDDTVEGLLAELCADDATD